MTIAPEAAPESTVRPIDLTADDVRRLRRACPALFVLKGAYKTTSLEGLKVRWFLQVETPRSGVATMVLHSRLCPERQLRERLLQLIPDRTKRRT